MKDIRNLLIVILCVILWLRDCNSGAGGEVETTTTRDTTTIVKVVRDTSYFDSTRIHEVRVPVKVPVYDTIRGTKHYSNPYRDSLITGTIETTLKNNSIIYQNLLYKPLFPKEIRVDSIITNTITVTTTTIKKQMKLQAGVTLLGNNTYLRVIPNLGLKLKSDHSILLGYNPLDRSGQVTLLWPISFKKNK